MATLKLKNGDIFNGTPSECREYKKLVEAEEAAASGSAALAPRKAEKVTKSEVPNLGTEAMNAVCEWVSEDLGLTLPKFKWLPDDKNVPLGELPKTRTLTGTLAKKWMGWIKDPGVPMRKIGYSPTKTAFVRWWNDRLITNINTIIKNKTYAKDRKLISEFQKLAQDAIDEQVSNGIIQKVEDAGQAE